MGDIRNEFVPYELALRMKALEFDEPCFGYYKHEELLIEGKYKNSDHGFSVSAPTWQSAFRWFRDNYGLIGDPIPLSTSKNGPTTHYGWNICSSINAGVDWENDDDGFKTYEEAQLACLEELCEIVENRKKDEK